MKTDDIDKMQGHWILSKMGKKVLRPGGREMTLKLIKNLNIDPGDDVVEFAPGLGFTADLVLKCNPKSYTGIELDTTAVKALQDKIAGTSGRIIIGNASKSGLPENSCDKVFGEAMLTMQSDNMKTEIIKEAHRILKKGGLYAIHELGLFPSEVSGGLKTQIQKDLSHVIKVNARPLTQEEWVTILEKEGFLIKKIITNSMGLLQPKRIIEDEGFFSTLKIVFNILRNPKTRKRIAEMRNVFKKYRQHINAVAIIALKH